MPASVNFLMLIKHKTLVDKKKLDLSNAMTLDKGPAELLWLLDSADLY